MITERINKWDCECVVKAANMVEDYLKHGFKAWRVGCVVYWVESSTD